MSAEGNLGYPYGWRPAIMESSPSRAHEEAAMFDHHCTSCDRRLLIFPGQVTGLTNTDRGIVVAFTCWCGSHQALVTGRRATDARAEVRRPTDVAA